MLWYKRNVKIKDENYTSVTKMVINPNTIF